MASSIEWHSPCVPRALAVLVAAALDRFCGEPPARLHPVVGMGRLLSALGRGAPWPQRSRRAAFARGAGVWTLAAVAVVLVAVLAVWLIARAAALAALTWPLPSSTAPLPPSAVGAVLEGLALGLLLKPLIAFRLLRTEVDAVGAALRAGLTQGREQLARLVSRDTCTLTATEVRESALESLAENLNDSWVAPLFWFALLGLPGAALYRFANTADAMWGYRGAFEWAGKWAARADDALSYIGARLTAGLLALAAPASPRSLGREARLTPSPNGGWPMGMLALALGVRLGKPGVYVLNAAGRAASEEDERRALKVASRAARLATLLCALGLLMVAQIR